MTFLYNNWTHQNIDNYNSPLIHYFYFMSMQCADFVRLGLQLTEYRFVLVLLYKQNLLPSLIMITLAT